MELRETGETVNGDKVYQAIPSKEEVYGPAQDLIPAYCRCGREVRKLNAASDEPKCVGCGYVEDLCRCRCYRPKNHEGACGEPLSQEEAETAILYGSHGPHPEPQGIIYA